MLSRKAGLQTQSLIRIEAILMDNDAQKALRFLREVIRVNIKAKGSRDLDAVKSTGLMT